MMAEKFTFSVVIPVYNQGPELKVTLNHVFEQQLTPLEVVLVDDGSNAETKKIIKEQIEAFAPRVVLVSIEKNGGAAYARYQGARKARGNVFVFLDADCVPDPQWLSEINRLFKSNPEVRALGGGYSHDDSDEFIERMCKVEEEHIFHVFSYYPELGNPPGGNFAVQRDTWKMNRSWIELKYFSHMASGEDTVVVQELRRHGKVLFAPTLTVRHLARNSKGYFRRHWLRGYSRTMIAAHQLAPIADTKIHLEAYGGFSLFVASSFLLAGLLTLGAGIFSRLSLFFPVAAGFFFFHWYFSRHFFKFVKKNLEESRRPLGFSENILMRLILGLRNSCWVAGSLHGLLSMLRNELAQKYNVFASIFHFYFPGKISRLFFFVTAKCNARCSFCFNLENVVNWKERKPFELTLGEIEKVAKNFKRLPYITMSGGEPFIRKDLPAIVEAFYRYSKTQWVTIPTNAALTKETIEQSIEILYRCPNLYLTVQISLDSMYEDHDESRKISRGFERMTETLKQLGHVRSKYKNLRIQIATCYDEFNIQRMDEIIDFCNKEFEYDQQVFYLIREPNTLVTTENNKLVSSYIELLKKNERHEWKKAGNRKRLWSRVVRTLQGLSYIDLMNIKLKQEYLRPCTATRKFVTLYDDGQISPCESLEKTRLGNIRDYNFDFYQLARQRNLVMFHKVEIVEKKCNCDWMCAIPMNMLYQPKTYIRFLKGFFDPSGIVGSAS